MISTFDQRWQRCFAASGFIFAVLVGIGLEGFWAQPPSFGLSATATAHYYAAHQSGFRIGITLITIGMAFLLAWTVQYGYMLWQLNDASPDGGSRVLIAVIVASLLASPILLSFDLAIFAIAAFRPLSTSPDVTRALSDVAWISSELIWPMLAVGMALGGIVMLRTRAQPRGFPAWLGHYSLIAAAIELFQIPIIFVKTGVLSANGPFPWYSTTFSWGIWAMCIGAAMWRNSAPSPTRNQPTRTAGQPRKPTPMHEQPNPPLITPTTRNRLGGICAIATLLLFAGGWAAWATPGLPDMNSATAVANWFAVHEDACRVAAILGSLSLATMIMFEVCLYGILREAEGGDGTITRAYFGGALLTVVFDLMFLQFLFTVAWRPGHTLPAVTQALNDLYLGPGVAAFACWMLMFGAIGTIVLRRGGLPRILGQTALAVAAAQLLFIPTSFVHGGIFDISNGLLGVFIPLGTPLIWGACAGIHMLRRSEPAHRDLPAHTHTPGRTTVPA